MEMSHEEKKLLLKATRAVKEWWFSPVGADDALAEKAVDAVKEFVKAVEPE